MEKRVTTREEVIQGIALREWKVTKEELLTPDTYEYEFYQNLLAEYGKQNDQEFANEMNKYRNMGLTPIGSGKFETK